MIIPDPNGSNGRQFFSWIFAGFLLLLIAFVCGALFGGMLS
jgi:hypothetical protein